MSMINIDDLYIEKKEKEENKKKIYDNVLKKCHNKIMLTSKMNPYEQWCYFVIPKFIYGIPLYNFNDCLYYIVHNLTKNGFKINYTHPNLLIISWIRNGEEKGKLKIENTNNYKSINDYKPSGNLIYNHSSLNMLNKKKNNLFNN